MRVQVFSDTGVGCCPGSWGLPVMNPRGDAALEVEDESRESGGVGASGCGVGMGLTIGRI